MTKPKRIPRILAEIERLMADPLLMIDYFCALSWFRDRLARKVAR